MNHKTTGSHSSGIIWSNLQMTARKGRKQQCITNYIKTAPKQTKTMQQKTEKTQNNKIHKKYEQQPRTGATYNTISNTTRPTGMGWYHTERTR